MLLVQLYMKINFTWGIDASNGSCVIRISWAQTDANTLEIVDESEVVPRNRVTCTRSGNLRLAMAAALAITEVLPHPDSPYMTIGVSSSSLSSSSLFPMYVIIVSMSSLRPWKIRLFSLHMVECWQISFTKLSSMSAAFLCMCVFWDQKITNDF